MVLDQANLYEEVMVLDQANLYEDEETGKILGSIVK